MTRNTQKPSQKKKNSFGPQELSVRTIPWHYYELYSITTLFVSYNSQKELLKKLAILVAIIELADTPFIPGCNAHAPQYHV